MQLLGWIFSIVLLAALIYLFPIIKFIIQIRRKVQYKEPDLSNRYSKTKIPKNIDCIVIGSGMGGLVTAALLAKQGKKVIILEQHTVLGGSCHSFKEKGYQFESGFHYTGNNDDYVQILNLALSKPIEWNLVEDYDKVIFEDGEKPFIFKAPEQKLIEALKERFPDETKKIDLFVHKANRAQTVTTLSTLINFWFPSIVVQILTKFLLIIYGDVFHKTSEEVCKNIGITENKHLYAVLMSQFVNYGTPPSQSPFAVGSGCPFIHFAKGALYPKEKPEMIVKSIVSTIEQCGGKCLVKADVEKLLVEKNKVTGVVLKNGDVIEAKKVISSAGLAQTQNMLPERNRWKYPNFKPGISHFVGFFGINKDLELPGQNLWYLPIGKKDNYDLEGMVDKYKEKLEAGNADELDDMYVFISFPTGKTQEKTDKHSCIMLAEATWDMVERYKQTTVKRNEGYKEFKEKVLAQMTKRLTQFYPEVKDHIEFSDLGTPLSVEHYLAHYSSCGFRLDTQRFCHTSVGPCTPVGNLFLAGQDAFYPGICGAIVSGFFAALQVNRLFN